VAIDERIQGFVHDAGRAFAKLADDFVLADLLDCHLIGLAAPAGVRLSRLASKYNTIKLDVCVTCDDFAQPGLKAVCQRAVTGQFAAAAVRALTSAWEQQQ